VHPADHIKVAVSADEYASTLDNETGPSRVLHQGTQRTLHTDRLNFDDTPISDGPFLHRALDRRPTEFSFGAPAGDRQHAIDMTFPENRNSPAWFQMLGMHR